MLDPFRIMSATLNEVLERNKSIWRESEKLGLKPGATFGVDFEFYATKPEERDQILPILQARGMRVDVKQTRVLIVFKGWHIKATEEAQWTFETLQKRTEEIYAEAAKIGILFEGLGMFLPQPTGQV